MFFLASLFQVFFLVSSVTLLLLLLSIYSEAPPGALCSLCFCPFLFPSNVYSSYRISPKIRPSQTVRFNVSLVAKINVRPSLFWGKHGILSWQLRKWSLQNLTHSSRLDRQYVTLAELESSKLLAFCDFYSLLTCAQLVIIKPGYLKTDFLKKHLCLLTYTLPRHAQFLRLLWALKIAQSQWNGRFWWLPRKEYGRIQLEANSGAWNLYSAVTALCNLIAKWLRMWSLITRCHEGQEATLVPAASYIHSAIHTAKPYWMAVHSRPVKVLGCCVDMMDDG